VRYFKPFLPGLVIILIGICLFWASTRKSLSERAQLFLEGQATIAIPAGLAALGIGAWTRPRDESDKPGTGARK